MRIIEIDPNTVLIRKRNGNTLMLTASGRSKPNVDFDEDDSIIVYKYLNDTIRLVKRWEWLIDVQPFFHEDLREKIKARKKMDKRIRYIKAYQ